MRPKKALVHIGNFRILTLESGMSDDSTKAIVKEQKGKAEVEAAVEKAAPTGKDVPEATREAVEGTNTAHNPDQPKPGQKNSAAQTEPALRTRGGQGGTIPHAHVSTPTGPVPAQSAEQLANYEKVLKESLKGSVEDGFEPLEEDALMAMNKPTLRSTALDRGYKIGEGGKRTLVRNFLSEQRKSGKAAKEK